MKTSVLNLGGENSCNLVFLISYLISAIVLTVGAFTPDDMYLLMVRVQALHICRGARLFIRRFSHIRALSSSMAGMSTKAIFLSTFLPQTEQPSLLRYGIQCEKESKIEQSNGTKKLIFLISFIIFRYCQVSRHFKLWG